jgi:hypothetical protein
VAWNGQTFLVVWRDVFDNPQLGDNIRQAPVSTAGAPSSSFGFDFGSQVVSDPAVASSGSDFLMVWERDSDIVGKKINFTAEDLTVLDFPISQAADTQSDPAVAFRGTYLVAWRDRRSNSSPDVYAGRVGTNRQVLDGNGFGVIATATDEDTPAVAPAPGANNWGVAYESGPGASTAIHVRNASK